MNSRGLSRSKAEDQVATEFPDKCGACKKNSPPEAPATRSPLTGDIKIDGTKLTVGGQAIHIKGINWNPVGKGKSHPWGLEWTQNVDKDSDMMQSAGINLVRTYVPLTDAKVLDKLWEKGIYVANTVYGYGCDSVPKAVEAVNEIKTHPSILMWVIGNEWNYNKLYGCLSSVNQAEARLTEVAKAIKAIDTVHPISTIYGEVPSKELVSRMTNIDIWGINAYRGISFGSLFTQWQRTSDLPMYLGEYGADAWNAVTGLEDQASQAEATKKLTQELVNHSAKTGGVCLGGVLFEFNDEWWKDSTAGGSTKTHDKGGIAPGGGPYPDKTFNEEWWGIVTIDRAPRQAYRAYKEVSSP